MSAASRDWLRLALAALLLVLAGLPFLFWWMDRQDPGSAVAVADRLAGYAWIGLWVGLGIAAILLLLYPPFLPSMRIFLRDLGARMGVDHAPMRQALARMEHHETSDDHHLVAQVLLQSGDPVRAFDHARRAVELDSSSLKAAYLLGRILQRAKNFTEAAMVYESVVARDPGYALGDALLRLGECLTRTRDGDDKARAVLEQHEQAHGPDRRAFLLRARLAGRSGDRAERMRMLQEAARPAADGERIPVEQALARARARVALLGNRNEEPSPR